MSPTLLESTVAGTAPATDLDTSLDRVEDIPARRNLSATLRASPSRKPVSRLRQSRWTAYLMPEEVVSPLKRTVQKFVGHKRKYGGFAGSCDGARRCSKSELDEKT